VPECDVDCYLQGEHATCGQRIVDAARHRFQLAGGDKCVAAADFVKDLCPSCATCPLKAVRCAEALADGDAPTASATGNLALPY
jgi:hypothetical protein